MLTFFFLAFVDFQSEKNAAFKPLNIDLLLILFWDTLFVHIF